MSQLVTETVDTVVAYDVMREAATHLVAHLNATSVEDGGTVPLEVVIERIRAVNSDASAVDETDPVAIDAATQDFVRRLTAA